jgi:hypothetical protein
VSWEARTPLQIASDVVTQTGYALSTQLSAREYIGLLDTSAALLVHVLTKPAGCKDWGEWPSRGEYPPTPLQIASLVLRALIFELRKQLSQDDYVELVKTTVELVAIELAED